MFLLGSLGFLKITLPPSTTKRLFANRIFANDERVEAKAVLVCKHIIRGL